MPQKPRKPTPAKPKATRRGKPKAAKTTALTPAAVAMRQEVFCLEYLQDFNASRAYAIAAGHKDITQSVRNAASRFLNEPMVQIKLAELSKAKMAQHGAGLDKILTEINRIAFTTPHDYVKMSEPVTVPGLDGEPVTIGERRPVLDMDRLMQNPDAMAAMGFRFKRVVDKDGGEHDVYELEQNDKLAALTALLKYHSTGEDPDERARQIIINVGFPVPGANWRNNQPAGPRPDDIEHGESEDS